MIACREQVKPERSHHRGILGGVAFLFLVGEVNVLKFNIYQTQYINRLSWNSLMG